MYFNIQEFLNEHPEVKLIHKKNDNSATVQIDGKITTFDTQRANNYHRMNSEINKQNQQANNTKSAIDSRASDVQRIGKLLGFDNVSHLDNLALQNAMKATSKSAMQIRNDFQLYKVMQKTEQAKSGIKASREMYAAAEEDKMARLGKTVPSRESIPTSGLPSEQ